MRYIQRQVRGLILKFLDRLYPDGATTAFIEGLLADWEIFIDRRKVLNEICWLIDRGYVEAKGVELPVSMQHISKFAITPKGKALIKGEMVDEGVLFEGIF